MNTLFFVLSLQVSEKESSHGQMYRSVLSQSTSVNVMEWHAQVFRRGVANSAARQLDACQLPQNWPQITFLTGLLQICHILIFMYSALSILSGYVSPAGVPHPSASHSALLLTHINTLSHAHTPPVTHLTQWIHSSIVALWITVVCIYSTKQQK